ncbi:hypothetical protein L7F22_066025 [Adiantum nelumboides]|nr:hypothetical protein [Adiantum nelumboides]
MTETESDIENVTEEIDLSRWKMGIGRAIRRKEKLVGHRSRTLNGHYKKDRGPDLKIACPIFKGKKHDDPDVHIQAFEQYTELKHIMEEEWEEYFPHTLKEAVRKRYCHYQASKLQVYKKLKKAFILEYTDEKGDEDILCELDRIKQEDDRKKKKKGSWSKKIDDMSKRISKILGLRGSAGKIEKWCTKCKAKNHTTEECTQCNYCEAFGHEWTSCKIKIHHLKEGKDLQMIAFASMEPVAAITEQPQSANTNTSGYNGRGRGRGRGVMAILTLKGILIVTNVAIISTLQQSVQSLDGGAGVNIIGDHMKEKMGITIINQHHSGFLILDVQGAYGMLLGRTWLRSAKAVQDYANQVLKMKVQEKEPNSMCEALKKALQKERKLRVVVGMKCPFSIRCIDSVYDLYVYKVTVVGAHTSKDNSSDTCVGAHMHKVIANKLCKASLETIHMPMVQNGKDIVDECRSLSTIMGSEDDESETDEDEVAYDGDTSDADKSLCGDVCDDDIESLDPLKDMVALHKEQRMFWEKALQQHNIDACNEDEMVGYGHGVSRSSEDDVGEDDAMRVGVTLGPCALTAVGVGQFSSGCDTKVSSHEGDRDKIYVCKDLMLMPSQRDVFNDTCPMVA